MIASHFDVSALLALAAALSWTLAALVGHRPARELGSLHFNRLRMLAAIVILTTMLVIRGGSFSVDISLVMPLVLSGLVGVVMGDFSFLPRCGGWGRAGPTYYLPQMRRLPPVLAGWFLARRCDFKHCLLWRWDFLALSWRLSMAKDVIRRMCGDGYAALVGGCCFGLLAALGQALGVLLVRPVMEQGIDPVMAGLVRVMVAAVVFWASYPFDRTQMSKPLFQIARLCFWLD